MSIHSSPWMPPSKTKQNKNTSNHQNQINNNNNNKAKKFQRQILNYPTPSLSSFSTSVTRTIKHSVRQTIYLLVEFKFYFSVRFYVYLSSIQCYFKHTFIHTDLGCAHITLTLLQPPFLSVHPILTDAFHIQLLSLSNWYRTKTLTLVFHRPLLVSSKSVLFFKDLVIMYMPNIPTQWYDIPCSFLYLESNLSFLLKST